MANTGRAPLQPGATKGNPTGAADTEAQKDQKLLAGWASLKGALGVALPASLRNADRIARSTLRRR